MAEEEKTFAALLSEAPLYQKSDTVSLTGALARSSEEGKFALMQADGSAITLDSEAVKSHTVIGSSFGQQIVQVEVDAAKIPQEVTQSLTADPLSATNTTHGDIRTGAGDRMHPQMVTSPLQGHVTVDPLNYLPTIPHLDHPRTMPYVDYQQSVHTGIADSHTGLLSDTIHTGIADTHTSVTGDVPMSPGDPGYPPPIVGYLPFALATGHQAPADALDQLNAMTNAAPLLRVRTNPNDEGDYVKRPQSDGTYPVRFVNGHWLYSSDY